MNTTEKVRMTVKLIDGTQEHYAFKRQLTDEENSVMLQKLQAALEAKHLFIDLGSKVQIIPMNSILQIEVEPPPLKLPAYCIKDVLLV